MDMLRRECRACRRDGGVDGPSGRKNRNTRRWTDLSIGSERARVGENVKQEVSKVKFDLE